MAQHFYLSEPGAAMHHVFVGAVQDGHPAVFRLTMDARSGQLQHPTNVPELAAVMPEEAEMGGPWFALHPSGNQLYASIRDGSPHPEHNYVASFGIDRASGHLSSLGTESTVIAGSPHCVVDRTGSVLITSQMGELISHGGGACSFALSKHGALTGPPSTVVRFPGEGSNVCTILNGGPPMQTQTRNQGHSAQLTMDGRVVIPDVGADKIWTFDVNTRTAALTYAAVPSWVAPPGSGPRHFAAHPSGRWVYLILEMSCTIAALDYDTATGGMSEINTVSTLPESWERTNTYSPETGWLPNTPLDPVPASGPQSVTTADIHVSPDGCFVYGTNRVTAGEGSIAIFSVHPATGALSPAGHSPSGGLIPRNMKIHPSGGWALVANQNSGTIVVFSIDKSSGQLTHRQEIDGLVAPLCIQLVPASSGASL